LLLLLLRVFLRVVGLVCLLPRLQLLLRVGLHNSSKASPIRQPPIHRPRPSPAPRPQPSFPPSKPSNRPSPLDVQKSDACGDLQPQKRNQSGRRCRSSGVDDGAEQHAALRACSGKGALDARSAAGMRHFLLIAKNRASLRANRAVADPVECARTARAIDGARLHACVKGCMRASCIRHQLLDVRMHGRASDSSNGISAARRDPE
jgi:hypothetical protein